MKQIITIITLCLCCVGAAGADQEPPLKTHPDSRQWPPLFAPGLTNATFPAGVWWETNGLLTSSRDEAIWTRTVYTNFVLDLEFKLEPASNSGVFLFCNDTENWVANHLEVQILDDHAPKWADVPPNWRCAGIFGHLAPTKDAAKPPGQWNRMTIMCQGSMIWVLLNGELVTTMDRTKWTSLTKNPDGSDVPSFLTTRISSLTHGKIGLQGAHGGIPTWFRNIRIRDDGPRR
jgi:hypothetical protein